MERIRKILKAYAAAMLLFVLLTFVLAAVISFTAYRESWAFAGLLVILAIVTFLLGLMAGNIVGRRGLLTGLLSAGIFLILVLLAVGGVFADSFDLNQFNSLYGVPILTGGAGGILGANKSR